jgi:hypothetical protein
VELLRSAKWQERVEAMGSVLSAVQGMGDPGPRCYELVQCVAFLPGWGEKNFQVGRPAHREQRPRGLVHGDAALHSVILWWWCCAVCFLCV